MNHIYNVFSYLLGGIDKPVIILLIVMAYVYITGWCMTVFTHKMNKLVGLKGIIRDIGYLIVISLATQLDKIMGSSEAIRILVIYFFIAHEGLIILKYWCKMGLPLPQKIYNTLESIMGKEDIDGTTSSEE